MGVQALLAAIALETAVYDWRKILETETNPGNVASVTLYF